MHASLEIAPETPAQPVKRRVAQVLLADADLASRLTLKTILSKAGYAVDGAATAAEAIGKLDHREYQLVLADLRAESEGAGERLLAYARQKDFHPATALIVSDMSEMEPSPVEDEIEDRIVSVSNENVSDLLDGVAGLISHRASRRMQHAALRAAS